MAKKSPRAVARSPKPKPRQLNVEFQCAGQGCKQCDKRPQYPKAKVGHIPIEKLNDLTWRVQSPMPKAYYENGQDESKIRTQTGPNSWIIHMDQYENQEKANHYSPSRHGKIKLDFHTEQPTLAFRFHDNRVDQDASSLQRKATFRLKQPITLGEFIAATHRHFKEVGLAQSPDNGIFGSLKKKNGVWEI